jgi:Homeodomain-like domain-containing protein
VLTVGNDAGRVERMLEEGALSCPGCGGRLAGWGHGRQRAVFGPGRRTRRLVRPRRSRCTACGVTHMLLPARMLLRRMDEAAVTGAALAAAARGLGYRQAASELGVPVDTVRGWLRRAAGRAGQIREAFTRLVGVLSADPVPLEPAGSPLADALVAVAAAAAAVTARWPELFMVSPWEIASAVTNATLLAPVMAVRAFNASSLS